MFAVKMLLFRILNKGISRTPKTNKVIFCEKEMNERIVSWLMEFLGPGGY
jgi:hypothetical protein